MLLYKGALSEKLKKASTAGLSLVVEAKEMMCRWDTLWLGLKPKPGPQGALHIKLDVVH